MKKKHFSILFVFVFFSVNIFAQSSQSEKLNLMYENGKYGYYNEKGKVVIKPQFTLARKFSEGLAAVNTNGLDNEWGFIDTTGKMKISAQFHEVKDFSEGFAAVAIYDKKGLYYPRTNSTLLSLWGYIDKEGNFVISPQYFHAFSFVNGAARFWTGPWASQDKYGIIDKTGKEIVEAKFDNISDDFYQGLAPFRIGKKWGFVDTNGNIVIEAKFDSAQRFSEGVAAVAIRNKYNILIWGFIDKDGKIVIEPNFSSTGNFSEGLAKFGNFEGKYGFIDKTGKVVIKAIFDGVNDFSNGKAEVFVRTNKKYIDIHGREEFRVKVGLIDKSGKYIEKPVYQY
jgi:hypothetical protein